MQRMCLLLSIFFAAIFCAAQPTVPATPQIQGVKVRSIILAPGRESATIELVNQSGKTITAFAYAYDITLANNEHTKGEIMEERIGSIAIAEAGLRAVIPAGKEPIKPGVVYSDVFKFNDPAKVSGLAVTMEVVIYADLSSESTNEWVLNNFITQRVDAGKADLLVAEAISATIQDEHPVKSAHDKLMKPGETGTAETTLMSVRQNLERGTTFANADEERKYLSGLMAQHRSFAATLAAHAKIARHQ